MRYTLLLALVITSVSFAKPSFVPGANCKACHTAMPPKKENITVPTAAMLKKYQVETCKNCHGWTGGKFTSKA